LFVFKEWPVEAENRALRAHASSGGGYGPPAPDVPPFGPSPQLEDPFRHAGGLLLGDQVRSAGSLHVPAGEGWRKTDS